MVCGRIVTFALAALFASGAALRAEAPFSFLATPGKLPKDLVPRSYSVTIAPDIAAAVFQGDVTIEIEVLRPTASIVFNALELEIPTATVDGAAVAAPRLNAEEQTATIALASPLAAGRHTLRLGFRGKIGTQTGGLYSIKYPTSTGEKTMLATQMEPTDARRMLPCWDEPVFRATFQLTAVVPAALAAVSNMPVTAERDLPGGMREVAFAPTPPMASYLVALFVGELEQITDEIDGVKLGIWTTKGKSASGRLALEYTKQIVRHYNDYFGVKYPLPKLDQVAVPGGFGGAMENWGAIVYAEYALLYDPASSSEETRRSIYGYVAHEIAHQWFGNLVTMAWWDNLWLNEGFASWMASKTMDRFNPDWRVWLDGNTSRERTMSRDARRGTHPIQQPVLTEGGVSDAFDEITYTKGQAFLRMLENFLGEETFRAGIRGYMGEHAYRNTTTADLWLGLESAFAKPTADSPGWLARLANEWISRSGFPVVSVSTRERDGQVEVTLSQEHFTINDPAPEKREWKVPVEVVAISALGTTRATHLLEKQTDSILLNIPRDAAVKINSGNTGLYRGLYSPALQARLAANLSNMSDEDRLNFLGDAWAMIESGRRDITGYLDLASGLGRQETSFAVWLQVTTNLAFIHSLARDTPTLPRFERWVVDLLRQPFARVGWDAKPGESPNDRVLRAGLITALGIAGDANVIAEARARFAAFIARPESLPADLREAVATVVGRHADAATWEKLFGLARKTESSEERRWLYSAFEAAKDESLARRSLGLALTNDDVFTQWWRIVSNVADWHPDLAWEFAKTNADALLARIPTGGAFTTRNTYFSGIARRSSNAAHAGELLDLVARKVGPEGAPEATNSAELIRFRSAFKVRELPKLEAWLRAQ